MFQVKSKYSITSFRCIYCWLWPQSACQYSVSTFNFKQAFVISVRKTSHKVLKKQKAVFIVIKVARPISFNDLSLHQIKINYKHLTILSSKFALWVLSVSPFRSVIWSAISSAFPRIFVQWHLYKSAMLWSGDHIEKERHVWSCLFSICFPLTHL